VPVTSRPRLWTICCAALLAGGCPSPGKPPAASSPPEAPRPSARAAVLPEKLGLRFLPVEEEDGGVQWLASSPIRCSAGEHDLVRCLTVTPITSDPRVNVDGGIPSAGVVAAEADTAHRLCAQRFGGRLPTPAERAAQGARHGLAALLVVQTENPAERFLFLELPEWTAEGTCDNPVRPGTGCTVSAFPPGATADAMRTGELSCTARRATSTEGFSVVGLGEACPSATRLEVGAAPQTLPCLVKVRGPTAADAPVLYALGCSALEAVKPPVSLEVRSAAYRCLVPPMAFGKAPLGR
jgi:hypothetical protein